MCRVEIGFCIGIIFRALVLKKDPCPVGLPVIAHVVILGSLYWRILGGVEFLTPASSFFLHIPATLQFTIDDQSQHVRGLLLL